MNFINFFIICISLSFNACSKNSSQTTAPSNSIWVAKSNEAKSCESKKGFDIDLMSKELENAGIKVITRKIIPDNTLSIQSCGADKGDLNSYLISKIFLDKAIALGFKPISPTSQP